ncbi:C40 family peptidase [Aeromicrobium sp. 179-A 4D2 NHS]|uniref:C40 family peptidase n=1 Tax=Aeromicrobium sp. 179-A 4D2 NHS TaxID=3142375 RepID=UPI0039A20D7F
MAASLLSIAAPSQAATATTTAPVSGIAAPSSTSTTSTPTTSTQTAAQKRAAAKKAALKKKRAAIAKKKRLKKKRAAQRRAKIVRTAAKYKGSPYRWGGTKPSGFDCSGYVQYVLKKAVKKKMPRVAGAQMKKGKKVAKGKKKKGDLIGFYNGSGVYHIGIYAGKGKIWHAPRPGQSVKKEKIWTSQYKVRRI